MTEDEISAELRQALDPVVFAVERLGITPDAWQERVLRARERQVLMNCSRQVGKSTVTAIAALHTALFRPRSLTLIFSKTKRQSGELLDKVYTFIDRMERPPGLDKDNDGEARLKNGSRIMSLPGDGTNSRSFSAPDLLIEDEAAFCSDDLFASVLPMLLTTNGRLWLLSSPNGKRGHFYELWSSDDTAWHRERITVYDSPRISEASAHKLQRQIGPHRFRQECLCIFTEAETAYFSDATIERAFSHDVPLLPLRIGPGVPVAHA